MVYAELLLRWFHILPAIALAGGVIFMRWPLAAASTELDEVSRTNLHNSLRRRWSKVVMITSTLLLVTGLVNAVRIITGDQIFAGYPEVKPTGAYHALVAVKLLLALALMMISSLLAGRSSLAEKLRQKANFWMNVNLALVVVIVLVGGAMKFTPREPVEPEESSTTSLHEPGEFAPWIAKTRSG